MTKDEMTKDGDKLRVICTDRLTHPTRELAVIWHHGDDIELLDALLAADDLTEDEAHAVYEQDRMTYFEQRRSARGGTVAGQACTVTDDGNARGPLWTFDCPTCRRHVPLRDDRLRPLVESLLAAGRVAFDISAMPS